MSTETIAYNNGQQAIINTDTAKVFLWNRRSQPVNIINGGGAPVTYLEGTVMGRVSASGNVIPCVAAAVDGSQFPIGVLIDGLTVAAGATVPCFICDDGDVASELLIFNAAETLSTVVSARQMRDWLKLAGIKLVAGTDLTGFANQ